MKRAYSPKEIAAKKWVTLPWDEKWSKPFGFRQRTLRGSSAVPVPVGKAAL